MNDLFCLRQTPVGCITRLVQVIVLVAPTIAVACPFCIVESQTLTEEIESSDAVVLATLMEPAKAAESDNSLDAFVDPNTGKARFRVEQVLVGQQLVAEGEEIEVVFFGDPEKQKMFFIRGVKLETRGEQVDLVDWNIPMAVSDVAVAYLHRLQALPREGAGRMRFFLDYLEHDDPLLAQDAYDEFARAPYDVVQALAEDVDKAKLWEWIQSREVAPSHRGLYFTLLGTCGDADDVAQLEKMLLADVRTLRAAAEATTALAVGLGGPISLPVLPEMVAMEQRRQQIGFNALVGCYLKLTGATGLEVIDEHFLARQDADPAQVYGVLTALRFLGEETEVVPRPRLLQSMRLVLDNPDFAEQAITDLARWEDWSVLERLFEMFKRAEPQAYVRDAVVAYVEQAKRQPGEIGKRAAEVSVELEQIDPESVQRARSLLAFGLFGRSGAGLANSPPSSEVADRGTFSGESQPSAEEVLGLEPESEAGPVESPAKTVENFPAAVSPDAGEEIMLKDSPLAESLKASGKDAPEEPIASRSKTESQQQEPQPEFNRWWILSLPLLSMAALMGLMWLILRTS